MIPTPVQYPVQQAPNTISVMIVQEAPKPEPVKEIPEAEHVPVLPQERAEPQEEPQEESEQSLGAVLEAVPLEFANPAPEYPALARRRGWEGLVIVQVHVEKDGGAGAVTLVQSSGHRILDEEAVATIKTWKFKPARSGSMTFSSTINIPVRFKLIEGRSR